MIIAILIVSLVGLFFVATNTTNKICWAISLCIFGVCIMLFSVVLYTSKLSYYVPQIHIDYYMYLAFSNLKLTMTTLAYISNIGIMLVLISYALFAFFLTPGKLWSRVLLSLPILFFFITNTPTFCYDAYIKIYSADNPAAMRFWENIFSLIQNANICIFLVYMSVPIIALITYSRRTKIFFLKHDAWISILCMTFIDAFVLYVFVFGTFSEVMFHNMDLLRFPKSMDFADYSFYTPALLIFLLTILTFFITFCKPFHSLSVISEKKLLRNDKQLSKNLRMILHTEKNMFFAIELLAKQGLKNEKNSSAKLKAILDISEQSIANLSRTLNLFRDTKMVFHKADLVKCINDALFKVFTPNSDKNITVKTYYNNYDTLYINMDETHIHELFLNLFRNSLEALASSEQPFVSINVVSEEGFAIIDVSDNGCGIEKKNMRKIFSPLFSTKSNLTNWGVGLHYVNKVLHLHNGRIRVKSKPGILTTFQVVIPLALEPERRFLWKKLK